jgi:predicted metal-dependent enzyme (double-stranded beta helix superfamily)
MATVPATPSMLTPTELAVLVEDLAADASYWQPLVRPEPAQRHFGLMHRDDQCEIWVMTWMHGHDTGFHDHGGSAGAIAVVSGTLVEERLTFAGPPCKRMLSAGDRFAFTAAHVHRMRSDSDDVAVSIHAYSPPLGPVGTYVVEADGSIGRVICAGDEELRPVSA